MSALSATPADGGNSDAVGSTPGPTAPLNRQSLSVAYTRKLAAIQRRIERIELIIEQNVTADPGRTDSRLKQERGALLWAVAVIEANKASAKQVIHTRRLEQDAIAASQEVGQ